MDTHANSSASLSNIIQRIYCGEKIGAILIRENLPKSGHHFVSEKEDSLQVGVNHYEKGTEIKPHFHPPVARALEDTVEVLHVDWGKCLLKLFDPSGHPFFESELNRGDTVVLISGGHALKMLEPTRIIMVKQGPYLGPAKDKLVFGAE